MPRLVRVFTALALGTAAFIELPILGWGPTDIGGFLAHPARLLYLVAALLGAMGLVLAWRIRDEEAPLRATFGSDWEAYARKSRRLIPFLY